MLRLASVFSLALLALALPARAQAIAFTGDVLADFPSVKMVSDEPMPDVGMPPGLAGTVSGWDIRHIGLSYDPLSDTLFVGIDFDGIAGDADGDGDPSSTSASLLMNGGVDPADFGGSESFAFALDLDGDGLLDIVAGVPMGADLSGFTVATYDNTVIGGGSASVTVDPYNRFDVPLGGNVGTIFATPSAAQPDIEFTIPNFSALLAQFAFGNDGFFGVYAFAGSLEDGGIGEDFVMELMPIGDVNECVPIPNHYEIRHVLPQDGGFEVGTRYGLLENYGCCVLYSLLLQPYPIPIVELPGVPHVLVGSIQVPGSLYIIDAGAPGTDGHAVACKDAAAFIPDTIPPGTQIHAQILSYPAFNPTQTFYTSNVVTYVHPGPNAQL
ncbi:MAG: hypothetical protein R3F20_05015 [Planctomycetota bacterium]